MLDARLEVAFPEGARLGDQDPRSKVTRLKSKRGKTRLAADSGETRQRWGLQDACGDGAVEQTEQQGKARPV